MFDSPFPQDFEQEDDHHLDLAERLKRRAFRVATLVLHSDIPWIDIEIEINEMRALVEQECPEKLELFEHTYVARFHHLRDKWRDDRNIGE